MSLMRFLDCVSTAQLMANWFSGSTEPFLDGKSDMAETGEDFIIFTEIFLDSFGLGRRLDDDEVHTATLYM